MDHQAKYDKLFPFFLQFSWHSLCIVFIGGHPKSSSGFRKDISSGRFLWRIVSFDRDYSAAAAASATAILKYIKLNFFQTL